MTVSPYGHRELRVYNSRQCAHPADQGEGSEGWFCETKWVLGVCGLPTTIVFGAAGLWGVPITYSQKRQFRTQSEISHIRRCHLSFLITYGRCWMAMTTDIRKNNVNVSNPTAGPLNDDDTATLFWTCLYSPSSTSGIFSGYTTAAGNIRQHKQASRQGAPPGRCI